MAIVNQSKPTTAIANSTKVTIGETWATITTTWASETRTWAAVSQLFTNFTRPSNNRVTASAGLYYGFGLFVYSGNEILSAGSFVNEDKPI